MRLSQINTNVDTIHSQSQYCGSFHY